MEPVERMASGRSADQPYVEFLRVPAMRAGVYVLQAGTTDRQTPHEEDELYYVVRGRARFRQGADEREVRTGDVLYVPARETHSFYEIEETLVLLVVFGPAESSAQRTAEALLGPGAD